jgi:hypothetical protein
MKHQLIRTVINPEPGKGIVRRSTKALVAK